MTPRFEERPYQTQAIVDLRAAMRECQSVILYAPTGSGKTKMACDITSKAISRTPNPSTVLFLGDSVEIIEQTSESMSAYGIQHGIIQGQDARRRPWESVHIATIQTLRNRPLPKKDLVFVDECHLARAKSWHTVIQHYIGAGAKVIGLSATPCRLDGKGLGALFQRIVYCPSIADLTTAGYLVPIRVFAPPAPSMDGVHTTAGDYRKDELAVVMDKAKLIGDAVDHYARIAHGRLAILKATGIEHSRHLAAAFVAAGIPAAHCDGETSPDERRRILKSLPAREILVLCQVDICGKGWDCPPVSCGIDCCPTHSLAKWLQFPGRIIRTSDGKRDAILLDHSGNIHRFGMPDDPREWSLEETFRKSKATQEPAEPVRTCRSCFGCFRPAPMCPYCGVAAPPEERKVETVKGDLEEIAPRMVCDACKREMTGCKIGDPCVPADGLLPYGACPGVARRAYQMKEPSKNPKIAELQRIAEERGYSPGWIWHQIQRLGHRRVSA